MDRLEKYRQHLDELKSSTDCAALAADLGIVQKGKRWFCPSCQSGGGQSPDLGISERGFHCFKCGEKGDAIALVALAQSCNHATAVSYLEEFTGIHRPEHENRATGTTQCAFQVTGRVEAPPQEKPAQDRSERTAILTAFIRQCRPLEGEPLRYMERVRWIPRSTIERANIHLCGAEFIEILNQLQSTFGEEPVEASGLKAFYRYYKAKVGFMLFPYQSDGLTVYLKARPPLSKQQCEELGIERFLFTKGSVPCFYMQSQLERHAEKDRLLICEGEIDTLSALAMGEAAVGIPGWAGFKTEWIEQVRPWDGRILLMLDGDAAGQQGEHDICAKFLDAGLQSPARTKLPPGKDLNDVWVERIQMQAGEIPF